MSMYYEYVIIIIRFTDLELWIGIFIAGCDGTGKPVMYNYNMLFIDVQM